MSFAVFMAGFTVGAAMIEWVWPKKPELEVEVKFDDKELLDSIKGYVRESIRQMSDDDVRVLLHRMARSERWPRRYPRANPQGGGGGEK